jgi:hypothetical protein
VTSALVSATKEADHRQGVSGVARSREEGNKYFVIKIFTSNPLGLKILPAIFGNPAPVKASQGCGEGGVPLPSEGAPETELHFSARFGLVPDFFSATPAVR